MQILRRPKVELIAVTQFSKPKGVAWETDTEISSQALIELAGRECYQSFQNPSGRSNEQYIAHLLEVGHLSVVEHAQATFRITGVSRALTHELVRHRHFSFSQLSQRFVAHDDWNFIEPDVIAQDSELHQIFIQCIEHCQRAYNELYSKLREKFAHLEDKTLRRKLARQAARMVLPNATETRIVVSANFRALRHFFRMRCAEGADVEIRTLAVEMLRIMKEVAPAVFKDFKIRKIDDGSEVASTDYTFD